MTWLPQVDLSRLQALTWLTCLPYLWKVWGALQVFRKDMGLFVLGSCLGGAVAFCVRDTDANLDMPHDSNDWAVEMN